MIRNAQRIAASYAASDQPLTVRLNACSALAAIGDDESAARLAQLAVEDAESAVRDRALSGIETLDEEPFRVAAKALVQQLQEPAAKLNAYRALGALARSGRAVPAFHKSFVKRVQIALTSWSRRQPERKATLRRRLPLFAVLGAGGTVFLSIAMLYFIKFAPEPTMVYLWMLSAVVLAPAAALAAEYFGAPVSFHPDPVSGFAAELLLTGLSTLVVSSGVAALFFLFLPLVPGIRWLDILIIGMCIGVVLVLIVCVSRTLGLLTEDLPGGTFIAICRVATISAGAMLALSFGTEIAALLFSGAIQLGGYAHPRSPAAAIWSILLPASVGVSLACALRHFGRADTQQAKLLGYQAVLLGIGMFFWLSTATLVLLPTGSLSRLSFNWWTTTQAKTSSDLGTLDLSEAMDQKHFHVDSDVVPFLARTLSRYSGIGLGIRRQWRGIQYRFL